MRALCFKIIGLMLRQDKAGVFRQSGLIVKPVDVVNLGDDSGGVHMADAFDRGQGVRNDFKLFSDSLVKSLDLCFQSAY